jgi:hypothetical protein
MKPILVMQNWDIDLSATVMIPTHYHQYLLHLSYKSYHNFENLPNRVCDPGRALAQGVVPGHLNQGLS